jgi:hypothetical protein
MDTPFWAKRKEESEKAAAARRKEEAQAVEAKRKEEEAKAADMMIEQALREAAGPKKKE